MTSLERWLAVSSLLAPFALLFPWAVVPSHLGVGLAGPRFFLHWLTKYPSVGPINVEVLLGTLCLVATAVLPAAAASYRLAGGRRPLVAIALATMALIAYLPVLVRLDVDLAMVGLFGAGTLVGRVDAYHVAGGPLLRALAVVSTVGLAICAARAARRPAGSAALQ